MMAEMCTTVCNAARDTGVVASCGGDTVCLIDCGTGQVMKRFRQQKEVCVNLPYLLFTLFFSYYY